MITSPYINLFMASMICTKKRRDAPASVLLAAVHKAAKDAA